jgi:hypothetical protein
MTNYWGGENIALKVPTHEFEGVVKFYAEVLRLPIVSKTDRSYCFHFGKDASPIRLWIDRTDHLSQAEAWFEIRTEDVSVASTDLAAHGVVRADQIEELPEGFKGFWIIAPGDLVHLVSDAREIS